MPARWTSLTSTSEGQYQHKTRESARQRACTGHLALVTLVVNSKVDWSCHLLTDRSTTVVDRQKTAAFAQYQQRKAADSSKLERQLQVFPWAQASCLGDSRMETKITEQDRIILPISINVLHTDRTRKSQILGATFMKYLVENLSTWCLLSAVLITVASVLFKSLFLPTHHHTMAASCSVHKYTTSENHLPSSQARWLAHTKQTNQTESHFKLYSHSLWIIKLLRDAVFLGFLSLLLSHCSILKSHSKIFPKCCVPNNSLNETYVPLRSRK